MFDQHPVHPSDPRPVPGTPRSGAPHWDRQRHSPMPSHRYRDAHSRVALPNTDRAWPSARFSHAPLWVPVDLRDGNQALAEPMDPERKRRFFTEMVRMGYAEIEVGYPSASQADFDFVRMLAETDLVPEHVTIVVFSACRRDLIERTVASIRGIRNEVVIHLYAATAPTWRDTVLGKSRAELAALIEGAGRDALELAGDLPNVRFQFSPEVFNLTEPDYVLELCSRMTTLWDASPERPVILNLPATVEIASPNVYADQIEYMHRNLDRRDSVILSVHPHNDRGTGVACAELAVLAGAQRVEGCIFGNGERTGNVDLATLALNLHAQGVDPMIDFSDIDRVRRTVEHCTRMPVPERHPYVGDLVHTAFSGTHQDAIKKGFAEHRARALAAGIPEGELDWRVPYLPVDPADLGRSYDAVIRVNSQSGKGGIAHLLLEGGGLDLPRRLQIDFARIVQARADESGEELGTAELLSRFRDRYLAEPAPGDIRLAQIDAHDRGGERRTEITLLDTTGEPRVSSHRGLGEIEALAAALAELGAPVAVLSLSQQSLGAGNDSEAISYLEFRGADGPAWVAGQSRSTAGANAEALLRAANALRRAGEASAEPLGALSTR